MVGTPAHCQTGTCAPALEFLVKSQNGSAMPLAWSMPTSTPTMPRPQSPRPSLHYGLEYEPVLYFAKDGVVDDRIDVIWDQSELDERLDAAWRESAEA